MPKKIENYGIKVGYEQFTVTHDELAAWLKFTASNPVSKTTPIKEVREAFLEDYRRLPH